MPNLGSSSEAGAGNIVRTFWHGSPLSIYEVLSLRSFVHHGHEVQLFAYGELEVPDGVKLLDANSILPEAEIFYYEDGWGKGSVAAFSNFFRYKLLYELGGTWVDTDTLCLKPFDDLPVACAGLQDEKVNSAILRLPKGHPIAKELYERARELGRNIYWGQAGPRLLTEVASRYLDNFTLLPKSTFYPIHWRNTYHLILPEMHDACESAAVNSYSVHWWNEVLRRIGLPKDRLPPKGSWLSCRAMNVLGNVSDFWPSSLVETWIQNADLAEPAISFLQGKGEIADLLRDLGIRFQNLEEWPLAVKLLSGAQMLRPDGPYICLKLAQALIETNELDQVSRLLDIALSNNATRAEALALAAKMNKVKQST